MPKLTIPTKIVAIICLLFLFLVASDIFPQIRGPNDLLLNSRWPYYFVNSFSKVWAPVLASTCLIILWAMRSKISTRSFFFILITVGVVWQLSLVYFSRFGLGVLFRRLVDPGINGYFSTSIKPYSSYEFLTSYPEIKDSLDQHARSHPPGLILVMRSVSTLISQSPGLVNLIHPLIPTPDGDTYNLWSPLTKAERASAILIICLLLLLTAASTVPVYLFTSHIFDTDSAKLASILFMLSPAISFFALLGDPLYTILPTVSHLLLLISKRTQKKSLSFLAGLIFVSSLFFSVVPLVVGFLLFVHFYITSKSSLKNLAIFLVGAASLVICLSLFDINLIRIFISNIGDQAAREYHKWVFYNIYDISVFLGLPTALAIISITITALRSRLHIPRLSPLLFSFLITIFILSLSGISRGETGRTWLPLFYVPIGIVSAALTKYSSPKTAVIILVLTSLQSIFLEEFWVPVW